MEKSKECKIYLSYYPPIYTLKFAGQKCRQMMVFDFVVFVFRLLSNPDGLFSLFSGFCFDASVELGDCQQKHFFPQTHFLTTI
jgi:hypothetical protein